MHERSRGDSWQVVQLERAPQMAPIQFNFNRRAVDWLVSSVSRSVNSQLAQQHRWPQATLACLKAFEIHAVPYGKSATTVLLPRLASSHFGQLQLPTRLSN